ncbi:hypothetical protein E2C01_054535 [Portunus trituberculatus]|uniref:Uncharacterized protein n=1 Tax=Portunus trituberculatus TaxID=210409 RepID=A0A5B7GSB4_PORTR|nr:hypothetical protein [Portunus trituberculatus]
MARLPPAPDGTPRQLDLLRALWLLRLPESICAAIPNAEEIDENELQEKADHLTDALWASSQRIHALCLLTSSRRHKTTRTTSLHYNAHYQELISPSLRSTIHSHD